MPGLTRDHAPAPLTAQGLRFDRIAGLLFLGAACLLVSLTGCSKRHEEKEQTRALAQRCTAMSKSLNDAGVAYATQLQPWLAGETIDIPALQSALQSMEILPGQFKAELEAMPYPATETAVTEYRSAALSYLAVEQEMVDFLKRVNGKVVGANPAPESLRKEVMDEMEKLAATEQKAVQQTMLKVRALNSFLLK